MAKMERMVRVLPRPMRLRMMEKRTMNQTALTGVPVRELILEKKLCDQLSVIMFLCGRLYGEKGIDLL